MGKKQQCSRQSMIKINKKCIKTYMLLCVLFFCFVLFLFSPKFNLRRLVPFNTVKSQNDRKGSDQLTGLLLFCPHKTYNYYQKREREKTQSNFYPWLLLCSPRPYMTTQTRNLRRHASMSFPSVLIDVCKWLLPLHNAVGRRVSCESRSRVAD